MAPVIRGMPEQPKGPPPVRRPVNPVTLPPLPTVAAPIASILEYYAQNPRDRYYKDQEVHLDGYTFTNCCFNNCRLITETGIFALRSCLIFPNCTFQYGPAAARVIRLWNVRNLNLLWPDFSPKVEAEGSVTIE